MSTIADQMHIEMIATWDTFANANINNTLFCATLSFFKRNLFKIY